MLCIQRLKDSKDKKKRKNEKDKEKKEDKDWTPGKFKMKSINRQPLNGMIFSPYLRRNSSYFPHA